LAGRPATKRRAPACVRAVDPPPYVKRRDCWARWSRFAGGKCARLRRRRGRSNAAAINEPCGPQNCGELRARRRCGAARVERLLLADARDDVFSDGTRRVATIGRAVHAVEAQRNEFVRSGD